jgi:hypothetical protein
MLTTLITLTILACIAIFGMVYYEVKLTLLNKRVDSLLNPQKNPNEFNVSGTYVNNDTGLNDYSHLARYSTISSVSKNRLEYNPETRTYTKVQVIDDSDVEIIRSKMLENK